MKKLLMLVLLFAFAAPLVMAQTQIQTPKAVVKEGLLEDFENLPQVSQKRVADFLGNLQKTIQETELKKAKLPQDVEDTQAIDAILPFITAVEQDYYVLVTQDAQAAQLVGNMLYTAKFHVKGGAFTIPQFIVKYRSYIQTRTDLDAFYNDLVTDAEVSKK